MAETRKVALVLETSGGGSGRHVLDLAEGLVTHGVAVSVIWSSVRAQQDFVDRLKGLEGVRSIPLVMHRAVGPRDVVALRALAQCIITEGPFDILHGHSSKAGALVRLLPDRLPGARIYTPHAFRTMDPELGLANRVLYGNVERLLARRADRIIVVSKAEYTHAINLGIEAERLSTVVNGASLLGQTGREAARAEMGLGPDEIAVGFIGRLDRQKDPLRFVAAVINAARAVPKVHGVVIGDGPLRAEAEALAGPGRVRFLGWRDGPALFSGLDIFCMTSRYEAMPYTLLEALHAGVPILTTAAGGVEETVIAGENGQVLPTDCTAEKVGAALAALAEDEPRRRAFRSASRRLAERRTVVQMVEETLAVYEAALSRSV